MTDRPIIFSAPMVQALLAGRKTQTRRLLKLAGRPPEYIGPKGRMDDPTCWGWESAGGGYITVEGDDKDHLPGWRNGWRDWSGAYAPGDRLYVREAHSLHRAHGQGRDDGKRWGPWGGLPTAISPDGTKVAYYREGFDRCDPGRWRPSIHMPRWASRLTLTVTEVSVQRLEEISEVDAIDEGCRPFFDESDPQIMKGPNGTEHQMMPLKGPLDAFRTLWNSLRGPDTWDANPWVVAVSFTVRDGNIDEATP